MPSYITYGNVEYSTGSSLGQTILEALIDRAEAWLAGELTRLNVSGDTSDGNLQEAVMNYTISLVYIRGHMDGELPDSLAVGGLSLGRQVLAMVREHREEAKRLVEAYARDNLGDVWAESDYDAEKTVVKQDHLMSDYQMDQATVHEYHDRADEYGTEDDTEVT